MRKIAEAARVKGYPSEQWKMARPLTVQGVGEGDQECQWEASIPIVVPDSEGRAAGLHHFEAPQ